MNLLLVGGSGTLGTEILRQLKPLQEVIGIDYPSHKELNICEPAYVLRYLQNKQYDAIILSVGEKNQVAIEVDSHAALRTNVIGVANVVNAMQYNKCQARLVYISTGYVYKGDKSYHKENDGVFPCNKYAWSKLSGECSVRMLDEKQHLIIRCEFSKAPWHKNYAFTDQYTSREEIEVIAHKICQLIMKNATGTYNIGGKRKSVYHYAKSLSIGKEILKCKMKDFATVPLPRDSSLNTNKYDRFMEEANGKTS